MSDVKNRSGKNNSDTLSDISGFTIDGISGNFKFKFLNKFNRVIKDQIPSAWDNFKSWSGTFRGKLILISLIALSIFPFLSPISGELKYFARVLETAMIFAIYAASWDLLSGIAGQINFGHSISLGVGAYTCAISINFYGVPWFLAIFIGGFMSVLAGLIVGIPSLRLKGPYFASASMAVSMIFLNIFYFRFVEVLGGTGGISIPKIFTNDYFEFFVYLLFLVVCVVIMLAIANSNFGTVLKALRDDQTSAEAAGINKTKFKLYAFMISGFFGGIAGGLYTLRLQGVNPPVYLSFISFLPILMTFIGGIAMISGGVFGSFFYWIFTELLRDFDQYAMLIFAIILILVIRFAKRGLLIATIERIQDFFNILLGR